MLLLLCKGLVTIFPNPLRLLRIIIIPFLDLNLCQRDQAVQVLGTFDSLFYTLLLSKYIFFAVSRALRSFIMIARSA